MSTGEAEAMASLIADQLAMDSDFASAIADQLAERLAATTAPRLLTATEKATELGLTRDWVYANAELLGVVRLGDGERPRLRFPAGQVAGDLPEGRAALAPRRRSAAWDPRRKR